MTAVDIIINMIIFPIVINTMTTFLSFWKSLFFRPSSLSLSLCLRCCYCWKRTRFISLNSTYHNCCCHCCCVLLGYWWFFPLSCCFLCYNIGICSNKSCGFGLNRIGIPCWRNNVSILLISPPSKPTPQNAPHATPAPNKLWPSGDTPTSILRMTRVGLRSRQRHLRFLQAEENAGAAADPQPHPRPAPIHTHSILGWAQSESRMRIISILAGDLEGTSFVTSQGSNRFSFDSKENRTSRRFEGSRCQNLKMFNAVNPQTVFGLIWNGHWESWSSAWWWWWKGR